MLDCINLLLNAGHYNFDIKTRSGHHSDVTDRFKRQNAKRKYEISSKLDHTKDKVNESSQIDRITETNREEKLQKDDKQRDYS